MMFFSLNVLVSFSREENRLRFDNKKCLLPDLEVVQSKREGYLEVVRKWLLLKVVLFRTRGCLSFCPHCHHM